MATTSDLVSRARELGTAVSGQPENVTDALPRLAEILASQADAQVVTATVLALGEAWDEQAAQLILDHVPIDHPNTNVRLAVAQSLPNGVGDDDSPCRDAVIEALITLTRDVNSDVRDFACFGLGQVDAASPAAKDALAARLGDADDDTGCEALFALAKTGDSRAGASLQQRLAADPEDLFLLELRAAAELADPELHPLLSRLSQDWAGDDDAFTPALALALSRCRPEAKAQAAMVQGELVARVNTLLADRGLIVTLVGHYPRTALTFHGIKDQGSPVVLDAIWTERDPWDYPLEQEAQSFIMTYANETEEH